MKKLFLASSFAASHKKADELIDFSQKRRVGLIANAADPYEDAWRLQRDRERLEELGCEIVDVDLRIHNEASLLSVFKDLDVIFVAGGSVLYLLDLCQKNGFDQALRQLIEEKIYVGSSAGSIILAPELRKSVYAKEMQGSAERDETLADKIEGLNFVDFVLLPHWGVEEGRDKRLQRCPFVYDHNFPYISLGDDNAVWIEGDVMRIV